MTAHLMHLGRSGDTLPGTALCGVHVERPVPNAEGVCTRCVVVLGCDLKAAQTRIAELAPVWPPPGAVETTGQDRPIPHDDFEPDHHDAQRAAERKQP